MSKSSQFEKFINKKSNAAIKEKHKQDKRTAKKERAAAINKFYDEKRAKKNALAPAAPAKGKGKYQWKHVDKTAKSELETKAPVAREARPVKTAAPKKGAADTRPAQPAKSPTNKGGRSKARSAEPVKHLAAKTGGNEKRPIQAVKATVVKKGVSDSRPTQPPKGKSEPFKGKPEPQRPTPSLSQMPLNKFLAHSGVSGRREAADIVKDGKVTVNGQVVLEPGFKVNEHDVVKLSGKKLVPSKDFVYILLNKPKDYITTTDDPQGRKTVLQLIRQATQERVYPVGRLDRNTSGVLLITNDGDLAQKLSHPSNNITKIYEVTLDKPLTKADFDKIMNGITLEDGMIIPDAMAYADAKDKTVIGIEIHSGRNRIVRRIFESLQYDVRSLDRVTYAGLTKKNVQRGKWRLLTEREVRILKHFNK